MADLNALGFGLQEGVEALGFDFDFVHAQQHQRSFSNFTLTDVQYANKNGEFFIENISLEDNRHRNYNTTILKSDVLDIVVDGNFRNIRPIPFVSELIRSYQPAYAFKERRTLFWSLKQHEIQFHKHFRLACLCFKSHLQVLAEEETINLYQFGLGSKV